MVSMERLPGIQAYGLLTGTANSGWPAREPRTLIAAPTQEGPGEIIEEFEIDLGTWEITPAGPIPQPS
jgi:hypothetical protein